jgi:hypothetical protein
MVAMVAALEPLDARYGGHFCALRPGRRSSAGVYRIDIVLRIVFCIV